MPSSRISTLLTISTSAAAASASFSQPPQEIRCRFESGSEIGRIDPGLLKRFKQACAIAQDVPRGNRLPPAQARAPRDASPFRCRCAEPLTRHLET